MIIALLVSTPAVAQEGDPRPLLQKRLTETAIAKGYDGSTGQFALERDMSAAGGARYAFTIADGASYLVAAVCDQNCGQIGLLVTDANTPGKWASEDGKTVGTSEFVSDHPVLEFTAAKAGTYLVTVSFPPFQQCAGPNAKCAVGVGVFKYKMPLFIP